MKNKSPSVAAPASLTGSGVKYLIITNEEMKPAMQVLALDLIVSSRT